MSYLPLPKADVEAQKLIEELIQVTEDHQVDSVTLLRLEKRARLVLKGNVQVGRTGLGAVSALRFNAPKAREHFRVAMQNAISRKTALANYSVALQLLEEVEDALVASKQALELDPGNPAYLDAATRRAFDAGHIREAWEYCQRYNVARPDEKPREKVTSIAESLVRALEEGAFTEGAVQTLLDIACRIQQDHKVHRKFTRIGLDRGTDHSFSVRKLIWTTPEHAADMNVELADAWAEDRGLTEDPGLQFTLSYVGLT